MNRLSGKPRLTLEYNGQSSLYRDGTVALGIIFTSKGKTLIDALAVKAGSLRFPAIEWQALTVEHSSNRVYKFNLSNIIKSAGEDSLKTMILVASSSGKDYSSKPFDISGLII